MRTSDHRSLEIILAEIANQQPFDPSTQIIVASDGIARPLRPLVLTEIVSIVGEALFNAARHAHATHVALRIDYGSSRLTVSLHDDGVGIDAERLARAGPEGHYGVIGMHERASKMGASLDFASVPNQGTTIALKLAAFLAYEPDASRNDLRARWQRWYHRWRRSWHPGLDRVG